MGQRLAAERSQLRNPSARRVFRPLLPSVNAGGTAKALVLNHSVGVGFAILGSPTRLGNCVARPADPIFALSKFTCGLYGNPLSNVMIPEMDQPEMIPFASGFLVFSGIS